MRNGRIYVQQPYIPNAKYCYFYRIKISSRIYHYITWKSAPIQKCRCATEFNVADTAFEQGNAIKERRRKTEACGKHAYLAFVYLLSQFEANKELTSLRVQGQILTLHKSDRNNGIPHMTFPHDL